jgi:AhpC/TSA family
MRWLAAGAVMVLVGLPALWALDDGKDKPKEPAKSKIAEEVDAVIAAHQKAVSDFLKENDEKLRNAKTDEERSKIYEGYPKSDETLDKLWDLLEKNPKENEAAVTASQWLLNNYGYDDKGRKGRARVLDILVKDHADNPNIAPILGRLTNMSSAKAEELLRAVIEKNPARDNKAKASLYLGNYLSTVAATVRRIKETPEEFENMESYLGKETVMKLKDADAGKLAKEAEAAFEEAAAKFGDVVMYTNPKTMKATTIADRVAGALFEIRNLSIGKTVPDIEAEDLDGKSFKLSDYRGKVVVLDFWGNW